MKTNLTTKKYHLFVLGCQMNKSDAERLAYVLEQMGYQKTENEAEADVIIVVACSVRQSAVDRILGKIQKWQKIKESKKLILGLTGCVLPEDKPKLEKYFDFFFSIKDLNKLPQLLGEKPIKEINTTENYFQINPLYSSSFQAYVPISTGCDNFCSYCAVPYTRGREISRPAEEILCEVKHLIERGYKEITLLGQNVNSYKGEIEENGKTILLDFPDLLKKIDEIAGKFWIRFLTSHPKDMSDKLIKTIAECSKVCEYIHLPVQSGDNEILRKMNRHYTIEHYKNLIQKIRQTIPNVAISTDIIVGFPGETKEQFENTKKLMEEIQFDMAYIAQYSPRPGTAAARLKDDVLKLEKERREKELTKVLEKTAFLNNQKYLEKEVEVLPELYKKGFLYGRTRTFKPVKFKGNKNLIGKFVVVKITTSTPFSLEGVLVEKKN